MVQGDVCPSRLLPQSLIKIIRIIFYWKVIVDIMIGYRQKKIIIFSTIKLESGPHITVLKEDKSHHAIEMLFT